MVSTGINMPLYVSKASLPKSNYIRFRKTVSVTSASTVTLAEFFCLNKLLVIFLLKFN